MASIRRREDAPLERLLTSMAAMRAFEVALGRLWTDGLISGELHLGIGEEGVVAAVVDHLRDGDGLALDHRSTPPLLGRGVDPEAIVLELLGHDDGLCRGRGGHMHLFDPDRMIASSGIVGASVPTACGFALAHQQAGDGGVAVAFLGEGAANQGMVLEGWNLAVAWNLPVVFVVKDSGWAITTRSRRLTGASLVGRAKAFGLRAARVDGHRPWTVWTAAGAAIRRARLGRGPTVLVAAVTRPRGHLEGDPLVRMVHDPRELAAETRALLGGALTGEGASLSARVRGVAAVSRTLATMVREQFAPAPDPLEAVARRLGSGDADVICADAAGAIDIAVQRATARAGVPA